MRNIELTREVDSINSLIEKVALFHDDFELQAQWSKYICVLISGFIENSLRTIFTDYVKRTSSPNSASFASNYIEGIQNPKSEKISDLIGKFNSSWKDSFDNYVKENLLDVSINSIMGNRHLIAHGGYKRSSIRLSAVKEFFDGSIRVIEFIEDLFDPVAIT